MFKNDLKARLQRIFEFKETTFNAPNIDAPEQGILFIEIDNATTRLSTLDGGKQTATVRGSLVVFSQAGKHSYGHINKRIENAAASDTTKFIFTNIDDNVQDSPYRMVNLEERRTGFIFMYDSQYDPSRGALTSLSETLTFS